MSSAFLLPEKWVCYLFPSVTHIGIQCWVVCQRKKLRQVQGTCNSRKYQLKLKDMRMYSRAYNSMYDKIENQYHI